LAQAFWLKRGDSRSCTPCLAPSSLPLLGGGRAPLARSLLCGVNGVMAMHRRLAKELPQLAAKTLLQDGLAIEEPVHAAADAGGQGQAAAAGRGAATSRGRGGRHGAASASTAAAAAAGTGLGSGSQTSFVALLAGPRGSPYEGGVFKLQVTVPPLYPMEPPKIRFETRLFHPNVGRGHTPGAICLDILRKEAWSPALTLERTLLSIASLLADPNPASPMDTEAARLYTGDRAAYDRRVREWVAQYASAGASVGSGVAGGEPGAGGEAWVGDLGRGEEQSEGKAEERVATPPAAPAAAAPTAVGGESSAGAASPPATAATAEASRPEAILVDDSSGGEEEEERAPAAAALAGREPPPLAKRARGAA